MAVFTDSQGSDWSVRITVGSVNRVRELTNVELDKVLEDGMSPLVELLSDICKMADVVYCVCKPQCDDRGVTEEEFGERLCGDAIEKAGEALVQGLVDFFPKRQSEMLKTVIEKVAEVNDVLAMKAKEEMATIQKIEASELYSSVMNSQES